MSPRLRAYLAIVALIAVLGVLVIAFPRAQVFANLAAREPRYFS